VSLIVLAIQPVSPADGVTRRPDLVAVGLVLVCILVFLLRRRAPITVAVISASFGVAGEMRGYAMSLPAVFALVALASAAYLTDRLRTVALMAFSTLLLLVSSAVMGALLSPLALLTNITAPLFALVTGDVMRSRRLYATRWRERAREIEQLRDVDQLRAVAQERVRLAREVHDIVGHHLAAITLQARAGIRRLESDPRRAEESLRIIDELASGALAETRDAVGMIRSGELLAELRPAPALDDLRELLVGVQTADVRVELRCDAGNDDVPATLQTTAYRIVQEAISNVVKHARPTSAFVQVDNDADTLTIEVRDEGSGSTPPRDRGGGHGLQGMRERTAQAGGTLDAGPTDDGGWRIVATLPIRP
jgi:signal transduction histidine kinase